MVSVHSAPGVPGPLHRAVVMAGDLLGVVTVVFFIPFVIALIGIPIALALWMLLWISSWTFGV